MELGCGVPLYCIDMLLFLLEYSFVQRLKVRRVYG